MKTKNTKQSAATKTKTAASLRDLPARKNARGGGIKKQEQADK